MPTGSPKITAKINPRLRVIAFVLLCIGVQIAKNGLTAMIPGAIK
jgi:energy-coupling factor transporter transmembrane protein EcfT